MRPLIHTFLISTIFLHSFEHCAAAWKNKGAIFTAKDIYYMVLLYIANTQEIGTIARGTRVSILVQNNSYGFLSNLFYFAT